MQANQEKMNYNHHFILLHYDIMLNELKYDVFMIFIDLHFIINYLNQKEVLLFINDQNRHFFIIFFIASVFLFFIILNEMKNQFQFRCQ